MFPNVINENQLKIEEKYLCLDFSNTVDNRNGEDRKDFLNTYADLVEWAQRVNLIPGQEANALLKEAQRRRTEAEETLQQAISLRETIYRIFSAVDHDQPVDSEDIELLNQFLSAAMARARLVRSAQGYHWSWSDDSAALDRMLWPIARSAADLLTSPDLDRVGECASEQGCGWLFFDTTRNHSRRWCSMESCGNRAKAHRHYRRQNSAN